MLHEGLIVLEEVLELFIFAEKVVQHEELVLGSPDEVFQHLRLFVQVLAIELVEVLEVHVFDAEVALQLCDPRLKQLQVFCLYLEFTVQLLRYWPGSRREPGTLSQTCSFARWHGRRVCHSLWLKLRLWCRFSRLSLARDFGFQSSDLVLKRTMSCD